MRGPGGFIALIMLSAAATAAPDNPLLGQWQAVGKTHPPVIGFRQILFAPEVMLLDGRSVRVRGYDVTAGAVRVRTERGGDYIFILAEDGRICLAEADRLSPPRPLPTVKAGTRCFARRGPEAS
jgi:hypothetical protein